MTKPLRKVADEAFEAVYMAELNGDIALAKAMDAAIDAVVAELATTICAKCSKGRKLAWESYLGKYDHGGYGHCSAHLVWLRAKGRPDEL